MPSYRPVKIDISTPDAASIIIASEETDEEFGWFRPEEH